MPTTPRRNGAKAKKPRSQHRAAESQTTMTTLPALGRQLVVSVGDERFTSTIEPARISDMVASKDQFVWVDLQGPRAPDLLLLSEEFGFHPLAIEDATRHLERPKLDRHDGYYFLIFYHAAYSADEQNIDLHPISLFVGSNYLVTVHEHPIPVIDETIRRWQAEIHMASSRRGSPLYHLLDSIVDSHFPILDALNERVELIEEQIFERFDRTALQEIFELKRHLLAWRRVIGPERDLLATFIRDDLPVIDPQARLYFQDIYDHLLRINDSIDSYRELLSSALDAFLSIQSNQLNAVVKALTIASIVLMSMSLVAGIYGMNFRYMPELEWQYGYPFALMLMLTIAGGVLAFFRWRDWI